MNWTVTFYNQKVEKQTLSFHPGILANFLHIAEILHTKKSNISRLENVNSKISPKLSTIEEYARAVEYRLEVKFVPQSH